MNTIAARGIPGFTALRDAAREAAPLHRNTTQADVGDLVAFLASDRAAGITGQTLYVDCGLSALAAP